MILIRHADVTYVPGEDDPDLTAAGLARAQALRHVLADSNITAIFVTKWKRTQQTVADLEADLGVTSVVLDETDLIVEAIRSQPSSALVLVVGHKETLPKIVTGLGGPTLTAIGPTQFDRMFALHHGRLVRLRFGA